MIEGRYFSIKSKLFFFDSLRRGMEEGRGSSRSGRLASPQPRHTRIGDAPAHAGRSARRAAHLIAAHVRPDDGSVDPQRFSAARIASFDGGSARSSLYAVRSGVHELRRLGRDAPANRIRDGGSFRWVVCTLTRFLLDRLVYFNI